MRASWFFIATLLTTQVHAQTKDMDLGGAINFDEDAEKRAAAEAAAAPRPDRVEDLPIDQQPLPKADSEEYVPFLWKRALAHHFKGHYQKACDDFDALLAAGVDLEEKKAKAGRTYLACARLKAEQKDVENAQKLLSKSRMYIGDVPEMKRVLGAIARHGSKAALSKGNIEQAVQLFDEALDKEPDATDALKFSADLTYLARNSWDKGDADKAKTALKAALKYFPQNLEAQDLKREMWLSSNLPVLAIVAFLVVIFFVVLWILWRKMRANEYAKLEVENLDGLQEEEEKLKDLEDDND